MSINKVILLGRLGQDVDLRYTAGGQPVGNFTLATNNKWTDKAGNKQEHTEWHRIVVWGTQAENCKKYISKGSHVYVEGSLSTRDWEDKQGSKKITTEIKADEVQFLDPPTKTTTNSPAVVPNKSVRIPTSITVPMTEDDLPF